MADPRLNRAPGYNEAIQAAEREEEAIREYAMLGLDTDICGVPVKQLTPTHYVILRAARNPFLCGGEPSAAQYVQFLWVVSTDYKECDSAARDAFTAKHKDLKDADLYEAITGYIDAAFMDRPKGSSAESSPVTSFSSSLCHRMGLAYAWPIERTMLTPLAAIFQLLRQISLDANPNQAFDNSRSDEVKRQFSQRK